MENKQGIAALVPPDAYRAERAQIFPSPGSLDWYSRRHRAALEQAGAMLRIGGRWFVHAPRFDAFLLNGGRGAK